MPYTGTSPVAFPRGGTRPAPAFLHPIRRADPWGPAPRGNTAFADFIDAMMETAAPMPRSRPNHR